MLSKPANASHLAASIAKHKAGKAKRRDLLDDAADDDELVVVACRGHYQ